MDKQGKHEQAEMYRQRYRSVEAQQLGITPISLQEVERAAAAYRRHIGLDAEADALEANDKPPT